MQYEHGWSEPGERYGESHASYEEDESGIVENSRKVFTLLSGGRKSVGGPQNNLVKIDRNGQERVDGMKELAEGSPSSTIITFHDNRV